MSKKMGFQNIKVRPTLYGFDSSMCGIKNNYDTCKTNCNTMLVRLTSISTAQRGQTDDHEL